MGRAVAFTSDAEIGAGQEGYSGATWIPGVLVIARGVLRRLENADLRRRFSVDKGEAHTQPWKRSSPKRATEFPELQSVVVSPIGETPKPIRLDKRPGHYEAHFPTKEVGCIC